MKEIVRKIITEAENIKNKECVIIAIDGRCGSGKSTLADMISSETGVPMVHMDHFFLRPEQRTPERLAEPGGNVDRERFLEEVLVPLRRDRCFSYRVFRCEFGDMTEGIFSPMSDMYIIEGSYSCHPELWDFADIHVFLTVDPAEQMRRITEREGEEKAEVFRTRWIPMEEKYFNTFGIADKCDLVFDTTDKTEELRKYYEDL